ncbi:hypothetical protein [Dyella flagellata]|uniref:Uncharacterized protein n=1 Tax=Dyella flagellata TaxID=1867833 RepID=A0ABQ5X6D0_9GAMM|nr:hypothetical protein [Dyella flagellata]GLQ86787.1 hypothetical protein GCM10007898_03530 [Dyella flagellata]
MTNISDLDDKMKDVADWLSSTLQGISAAADFEIQDGGKFVLFRAPETAMTVSNKDLRALIYKEVASRFQGVDAQWMLVFLGAKSDVVDEIDSIIGVDF